MLIWLSYAPLLKWTAEILIVNDPLRPASAIVVLAGGSLPRAMEAAALYHAGWAPRIIASGAVMSDRDVLLAAGVPPSAIVLTTGKPRDTLEELQTISRLVGRHTDPVILVTSNIHTRRTRMVWGYVTDQAGTGIVRSARRDPFDVVRWWRDRQSAGRVLHEYLSILNSAFGSPLRPAVRTPMPRQL